MGLPCSLASQRFDLIKRLAKGGGPLPRLAGNLVCRQFEVPRTAEHDLRIGNRAACFLTEPGHTVLADPHDGKPAP